MRTWRSMLSLYVKNPQSYQVDQMYKILKHVKTWHASKLWGAQENLIENHSRPLDPLVSAFGDTLLLTLFLSYDGIGCRLKVHVASTTLRRKWGIWKWSNVQTSNRGALLKGLPDPKKLSKQLRILQNVEASWKEYCIFHVPSEEKQQDVPPMPCGCTKHCMIRMARLNVSREASESLFLTEGKSNSFYHLAHI